MKRFLKCGDDTTSVGNTSKKSKTQPNRKYDLNYLKFGFVIKPETENSESPIPLCVICKETLSNQSLKPSLLKRHQQTKHPETENKPIEFFQRKTEFFKKESNCMTHFTNTDSKYLKASYLASFRIVKDRKPHTVGETLILPAAKDMVQTVLGEKAAKELDKIPLSNNSVKRRIDTMASNIEEILVTQLKMCSNFSLQVDESTDITNMAQLLVFIRYDYDNVLNEEYLFCKSLESNTNAENIFKIIDDYLSTLGLPWKKCVGICTDGAQAMCGKLTGLVSRVQKVAPYCKSTHCAIHREALASKNMPDQLSSVLKCAVKVINFIKARALNSRLFKLLCEEMGGQFNTLLFHTEVRWLSRGKILNRLFELRSEVHLFLIEKDDDMKNLFNNEEWLSRLAYLADIFDKLNTLNMGLQCINIAIFTTYDKINSFKRKLDLYKSQLKKKDISAFLNLSSFIDEN